MEITQVLIFILLKKRIYIWLTLLPIETLYKPIDKCLIFLEIINSRWQTCLWTCLRKCMTFHITFFDMLRIKGNGCTAKFWLFIKIYIYIFHLHFLPKCKCSSKSIFKNCQVVIGPHLYQILIELLASEICL